MRILAVGGGSIGFGAAKPEVTPLSLEMIRLTGKRHPRVLFLPTASGDDRAYSRAVEAHFKRLSCRVQTLPLWKNPPAFSSIRKSVGKADLIYVGGGNTLKMIGRWKRLGVLGLLARAKKRGAVLAGTSAGAICWFEVGNSDSRKYQNPKAKLIRVRGLGFLKAMACPHYDVEKDRKPELKRMTRGYPGVAIALDNCAALEVVGERGRVLSSKPKARGYKVYWRQGKFHEEPLGPQWKPLSEIFSKGL
ncbi:MAG TPA: Type 1 glutamine amidotransferase-like domain-containing protein [bacterium]|nr:Type 1 glutamine amidotransferase-like domain-containing protein [bacterium]